MYKLLSINSVILPTPEGNFTLSKNDKYNQYEGEDGSKTVEVIREGIISASVSYKGLTEEMLKRIIDAITLVSRVVIYNPMTKSTKTVTAKITGISTKKVCYRNNISVWSLSFNIEEL